MRNGWGLTPQMDRFARELARGDKTQSDCYREAYPSSRNWAEQGAVHSRAAKVASDSRVVARVKYLQELSADAIVLDRARILREIDRVAFASAKDLFHEDGKVKLPHELPDAIAAAIKKFKIDEFGRVEYEFHDKKGFLDMAMKHRGLYEADNEQSKAPPVTVVELVPLQALPAPHVEAVDLEPLEALDDDDQSDNTDE